MSFDDFKASFAQNGSVEFVSCTPSRSVVELTRRKEKLTSRPFTCFALAHSRNSLNFWTNSRADPTDSIFVFYSDEKKVGVKTMRK